MKKLCYGGILTLIASIAHAGHYEDGIRFLNAKAYSKATESFRASAAERQLGFMYYKGAGVKQDNAQAAAWFESAATHGDLESQVNLGQMYENGLSVAQSDALSAQWFRMAAEQGHRRSQLRMGEIAYLGVGVPRDQAEAVKWWRLAMRADDEETKNMRAMVQSAMKKIPPETTADGEKRANEWVAARGKKP